MHEWAYISLLTCNSSHEWTNSIYIHDHEFWYWSCLTRFPPPFSGNRLLCNIHAENMMRDSIQLETYTKMILQLSELKRSIKLERHYHVLLLLVIFHSSTLEAGKYNNYWINNTRTIVFLWHIIWGVVCVKIHYWQTFRDTVWIYESIVEIYPEDI